MTRSIRWTLVLSLAVATTASAQTPPPPEPPRPWAGSIAAGIALTGGNTQTTTTNFAFDVLSDKTKRNVIKAEGLNLRSSQDGTSIVDRTNLAVRDEYGLSARTYAFGQFQYLRDVFKSIDYLMAPTAGIGYKLINSASTSLSVDSSLGAVVEKNPGRDRSTSGAVTLGEKLNHKLSAAATVTQSFAALWKTKDFDDALYVFGAGIASSVTPRTQIKVEFLDTYKNRPPSILVKKNDTALITSLVFKF